MVSVYSSIVIFSYMSTMYFSYYFSDANIWMLLKITKCNLEHHTDSNQSGQSFRNRAYINVTAAVTNSDKCSEWKTAHLSSFSFCCSEIDKVFTVLKSRCEKAVFFPETREIHFLIFSSFYGLPVFLSSRPPSSVLKAKNFISLSLLSLAHLYLWPSLESF